MTAAVLTDLFVIYHLATISLASLSPKANVWKLFVNYCRTIVTLECESSAIGLSVPEMRVGGVSSEERRNSC